MILAIDTATRWLGIALHDGTTVVAEVGYRCRNNHTTELTVSIRDILQKAEATPAALSGIAVAIGPGSYTGLRIGLAVAKGMALVNQTPLLGVPTLDILAAGVPGCNARLVAVAEAGRTRVSTAAYRWQNGTGWQMAQQKPTNALWSEVVTQYEDDTLFAGEISEKAAALIRQANPRFSVAPGGTAVRRAGNLAELGWQRLRSGSIDDPNILTPIYLRDPAGK